MAQPDEVIQTLTRGVESLYSLEELHAKLASGRPLRIKYGMDPTAPDIHLGHTVQLRKLRQFQDLGHKAILIIGDYTTRIGDPSGRDTTRPMLDKSTIEKNAQTYLDQAGKIVDTSPEKLELHRNSEWLRDLSFAEVMKLTGYFTVQQMLHRESFKKRMGDNREIVLTELLYPLVQAYDSVAIKADLEMGGTDQMFNLLVARDLMEKLGLRRQVAMVLPLLVGLDGHEKMSKSIGNYVAITDKPNDMFGKVMSIPDQLMTSYLRLLTDLPDDRIDRLVDATVTHPRQAKDMLARMVVELFHDPRAANDASEEFRRRFRDHRLPSDIKTKTVAASPIGILNLVRSIGFASSNAEARRLVEQGAVIFADQKVTDPATMVTIEGEPVLKVGKRRVCRVVVG